MPIKLTNTSINVEINREYQDAVELHSKILYHWGQAQSSVIETAKCLKKMRDTKGYIKLDCANFEQYVIEFAGFSQRQAYNFIKALEELGEEMLAKNSHLGITKLINIVALPATKRADFIEENDIANLSVNEIKELIESEKYYKEQITFLSNTPKTELINTPEIEEIIAQMDRIKAENEELKSRPIEVAVKELSQNELDDIKKQTKQELKKEFLQSQKELIKQAEEKVKQKALEEHEIKIEQVKKDVLISSQKDIEQKLALLEKEKKQALERSNNLAKQLEISSDETVTKLAIYFKNTGEQIDNLIESLKELKAKNEEKGCEMKEKVIKLLEHLKSKVEGV